jgi:two-component system alkaline phosphatase synthesis response regulator PhoP
MDMICSSRYDIAINHMDTEIIGVANKAGKILIVEDDTFLRALIAQKIGSKKYQLFTASEGEEALTLAEKEHPNLILLDIILPGMNGFEILEKIKNSRTTKDIVVIMLSNLSQQSDVERAKKLGAAHFFIKANTSPHEIAAKIEEIFAGRAI